MIPPGEKSTMTAGTTDNDVLYKVVVNGEGQYSIWPADRENPPGWTDAGRVGSREQCLAYVEEVWTDMRPLSLRKAMEEPR
jgi:MbtH protein